MVLTTLYFVSFVASFVGICIIPRTDGKTEWVHWIGPAFFLILAANGLVAGVLTLCGIPANILSVIATQSTITAASVAYCWRKKQHQRLVTSKSSIVALLTILLMAIMCILAQHGVDFTPHYRSTDAAVHLIYSVSEFNSDTVSGQYLAWNYIATWIEALSPLAEFMGWSSVELYYRSLLLCDSTFFIMAGLLFFSCIRQLLPVTRDNSIIAIVASLAYMLSYPLTNMIYGFVYLGVGVSVALLATFFTYDYLGDSSTFNYIGACLGLFGITISYPLFAPPIYLACFSLILWSWRRSGRIFTLSHIVSCFVGLLIPGLIGLRFFFGGTLRGGQLAATTQIAREGLIYRNLYSNFVFLIPLMLVAAYSIFKERLKQVAPAVVNLLCAFAYLFGAFFLVLTGVVSTYYFFKLHFLLAPFAYLLASLGAQRVISGYGKAFLATYSGTIVLIIVLAISRIDSRLINHFDTYSIGIPEAAHPYVDVYRANFINLTTAPGLDEGTFDLIEAVGDLYESLPEDEAVPVLGSDVYHYWLRALVPESQNIAAYTPWWYSDDPAELTRKISNECSYVMVVTTDKFWSAGSLESEAVVAELGDTLEIIYENEVGYVARISPTAQGY